MDYFLFFLRLLLNQKLKLTDEASVKVREILQSHYDKRDNKFGNGRLASNLFEKIYGNKAQKIKSKITSEGIIVKNKFYTVYFKTSLYTRNAMELRNRNFTLKKHESQIYNSELSILEP